MPIKVTIQTSADQDARLESLLATMNEQLVEQGRPPFADVDAMARNALIEQLKGWEEMALAAVNEQFAGAFGAAPDAQRQEVMNILLPPDVP